MGADYTAWLRKNFAWLFNPQGINSSSLGTAYVYGDAELGQHSLLGEYGNGDAKGKGRTEYIWLPTQGGNSIPVGMYRNGRIFAIHADHLGTPRLITDDENTPVWQWAYSAFGDNKPTGVLKATHNPKQAITISPVQLRATTPIEMNLRMPGQYFDEESGLFYNYYRNYQPNQGRYTQSDPIGLAGGLHRFVYVGGNPVSRIDPIGLDWIYQQSTGNLYHQPTNPSSATLVGTGYAGHGVGVNNAALEGIPNVGPIPQGNYTIGPQQTITTSSGTVLPGAMRLVPDANNWMLGRGGFIIHGGNMQSRTSSEGCIIQPPSIRNQIGNSGDRTLRVLP